LEFRVLGPLQVSKNGRLLPLGGRQQRAVLAILLLQANQVVSTNALINALWGERAPESAANTIQGYVSRLRKLLSSGDGEAVVFRPPGYVLEVEAEQVDSYRFERLVRDAAQLRASDNLEPARALLDDALALWRGEALADLALDSFVSPELGRLEELRLSALEQRIALDLALGRHTEVVAELESLVAEHPLREQLRGALMLALYRSGRQAEALEIYRKGRQLLVSELGIEPGPEIRELERAILGQDPSIEASPPHVSELRKTLRTSRDATTGGGAIASVAAPTPADQPVVGPESTGRRASAYRRHLVVSCVAMSFIAGTLIAIAVALTRGGSGSVTVVPDSVAVVDAKTNRVVGDVPVGRRPVAVAVGEGGVWVANAGDGTIDRIDPKTRKVVSEIGIGTDVSDVAVGYGSVWVGNGNDGTLTRIDPNVNGIEDTLRLGGGNALSPRPVFSIATGAGGVWVIKGSQLLRVDPKTNRVAARISIPAPAGLAAGAGAVWVVTVDEHLLRISPDPEHTTVALPLSGTAAAPTVGSGSLWLIVYHAHSEIWRVDPGSVTESATLGRGAYSANVFPTDLAVGDGGVWAVDNRGMILRLDPVSAHFTEIPTGQPGRPVIAIGEGAVWVAVAAPN
jgi:DNA-binding SARP family transcriptional activator/streptogramin lyase